MFQWVPFWCFGNERIKSYVLISNQIWINSFISERLILFFHDLIFAFFSLTSHRINKKGSQKDAEQKKSGNYFFMADDDDDGDDGDFDDI